MVSAVFQFTMLAIQKRHSFDYRPETLKIVIMNGVACLSFHEYVPVCMCNSIMPI